MMLFNFLIIDYAQALKFDQLREIIDLKKNFTGFNEADINFPPTYKFDVLKTVKTHKTKKRFPFKERARSLYSEKDAKLDGKPDSEEGKTKRSSMYAQGNTSGISSMNPDETVEKKADSPAESDAGDTDGASIISVQVPKETPPSGRKSDFRNSWKKLSPSKGKLKNFIRKKLGKENWDKSASHLFEVNGEKMEQELVIEPEDTKKEHLSPFDPVVIAPTPRSQHLFLDKDGAEEDASILAIAPSDTSSLNDKHPSTSFINSHSSGEFLTPTRVNSLPPSPPLLSNDSSEAGIHNIANGNADPNINTSLNEIDVLGRVRSDGGAYDTSSKQRVPSWYVNIEPEKGLEY